MVAHAISHFHQVLRRHWSTEARSKRYYAEGRISRCVSSPGAETALNAFLRRREYGKVTSRIPAMDPVAFGAACDFAMRYAAEPSRSSRREFAPFSSIS